MTSRSSLVIPLVRSRFIVIVVMSVRPLCALLFSGRFSRTGPRSQAILLSRECLSLSGLRTKVAERGAAAHSALR
jgi:hypothetical protein